MLTKLDRLKGYSARETCVALLSMLAILLFASAIADAQTSIVVSQQSWGASETNGVATFGTSTVVTSGGDWGPASPGGHSAAVNSYGVFVVGTSTGGFVEQFTNQNAVMTVIGESDILPGGMAIDRNNYLYISGESSNVIYKIPVNTTANGAYGVGTYGPINSVCPNSSLLCILGQRLGLDWHASSDVRRRSANRLTSRESARSTSAMGITASTLPVLRSTVNTTCFSPPTEMPVPAPPALRTRFSSATRPASTQPEARRLHQSRSSSSLPVPAASYTPAPLPSIKTTMCTSPTRSFRIRGRQPESAPHSDLYQVPYNSTSKTWAATPTLLATLTPACATPSTGTPCNDAITTVATDATGNVYFGTEFDGVFKIANNGTALAGNPPVIPLSGEGVKTIAPGWQRQLLLCEHQPHNSK